MSAESSEVVQSQVEEAGADDDVEEQTKRVETKLPQDKYEALKICAKEQGLNVGPFLRDIAIEWLEQNTSQDGSADVEISAKDAEKLGKDKRKREKEVIGCLMGIDSEDCKDGQTEVVIKGQGTCFRKLGSLFIEAHGTDNVPYNLVEVKPEFVKCVDREAQTDPRLKDRLPDFIRYMVLMNAQYKEDSKVTSYKVRILPPTPPVEEKPSAVDEFVSELMQPPEPESPSTEVVYAPPVSVSEPKPASTPRPNRKKERDLKAEREAFAEGDWEEW